MTRLICRLSWDEPLPEATAAAEAGIDTWLLPARWSPQGGLRLAVDPQALAVALPGSRYSLEWQLQEPLTPADERQAAAALAPWLRGDRALRIQGRPLLWVQGTEWLSHPHFAGLRLRQVIDPGLLLLAAGPPALADWEGSYDAMERIPCQVLRDGRRNYESLLFHAHRLLLGPCPLMVPCVAADPGEGWAHASKALYAEWLDQAQAWSGLRHPDSETRWVLVEHWQGHRHWAPPVPSEPREAASEAPPPRPAQERGWGAMEAANPALLVHGFHLDLLETMLAPLAPGQFQTVALDLYVSTPLEQLEAAANLLQGQGWPRVRLVGVENRGRDMAPFLLELLPRAFTQGHPWLLKLHTKRSPDKPGGERWGRGLLRCLASPGAVAAIQQRFATEPEVSFLAPGGCLVPTSLHLGGNQDHLASLLQQLGLEPREWLQRHFVAGSMWAARRELLEPLLTLATGLEAFEAEAGQTDGTLAHACERLIPALLSGRTTCVGEVGGSALSPPPFGYGWATP